MDSNFENLNTEQVIDHIFKDPATKYELSEFTDLGKPVHTLLNIYPKVMTSGKTMGETRYFLKSFKAFESGTEEVQVLSRSKSNPEEIVRQLWIYKLNKKYGYELDEIAVEKYIEFGSSIHDKPADILVYQKDKKTAKIVVEVKKPKIKDGIGQLKSYLNAEGSPIGVWSNGSNEKVILYREYPKHFEDTLTEIPNRDQEPKDLIEATLTLNSLTTQFNFKAIIQELEELVLSKRDDEFDEIFKIIYAKLFDEIEAEDRSNNELKFRKYEDPKTTYKNINDLFLGAVDKWPGIFKETDKIELTEELVHICAGPIERKKFHGANLRIMDDAFEYLIPQEAKKKNGQFFTPRYVIDLCVKMLNPNKKEYIMDPACGSAGFLLHAMEWSYKAESKKDREARMHSYASKYLWGIDTGTKAAKTSRALMLIAGDGHTNIYGPHVDSLDPESWFNTQQGISLISKLRSERLLSNMPPADYKFDDKQQAWNYFKDLKFDVILSNPPFSGEIKENHILSRYELAKPAIKSAGKKKQAKEERDVLFIERIINSLKPGGRAAIVLPQGKFNNSSLSFIRDWILKKGRILAIVGLHANTFKPHTGTKTGVLFIQKYTDAELKNIKTVEEEVAKKCPDYQAIIEQLLADNEENIDINEDDILEEVNEILVEYFGALDASEEYDDSEEVDSDNDDSELLEVDNENNEEGLLEDKIAEAEKKIQEIRGNIEHKYVDLASLDHNINSIKETFDLQILELKNQRQKLSKSPSTIEERNRLKEEEREVNNAKKLTIKNIKEEQKEERKKLRQEIVNLEKMLEETKLQAKVITKKGRLELLLKFDTAIETLNERWVNSEVSEKLDYPIFMAVSEEGGKDNSGQYLYKTDSNGEFLLDKNQNLMIAQDLVNYKINDFDQIEELPESELAIAEAFIKFAKENNFAFWKDEE